MPRSSFAPTSKRTKHDYPEQQLVHLPLMEVVRMHLDSIPTLRGLIHCPSEGRRTRAEAGILAAMGFVAGISDLLLLRARRGFHGMAMELKAPGELKKLTPAQRGFLRAQHIEGWFVCACDDPVVAWKLLRWYATGGESAGDMLKLERELSVGALFFPQILVLDK